MDYKYYCFTGLKNFFLVPRYYIAQTVNLPFEFIKELKSYFILHKKLYQENTNLKQLIKLQAARLQVFQSLELENIRLRELFSFSETKKHNFSLAHVIEVKPDLFKHQILLNRGKLQGAYVGQPVLNADGIIGSLVNVEDNISTAILITDLSYAIPVLNLRNGIRAIALGSGELQTLFLQHIPKTADIQEQDVFVTSGLGGKYPQGYIVGKVVKIKKEVSLPFASVILYASANLDSCKEVLLLHEVKEIKTIKEIKKQ